MSAAIHVHDLLGRDGVAALGVLTLVDSLYRRIMDPTGPGSRSGT